MVSNRGINSLTKWDVKTSKLSNSQQTGSGFQVTVEASVFSTQAKDKRLKAPQKEAALARIRTRLAEATRRATAARAKAESVRCAAI